MPANRSGASVPDVTKRAPLILPDISLHPPEFKARKTPWTDFASEYVPLDTDPKWELEQRRVDSKHHARWRMANMQRGDFTQKFCEESTAPTTLTRVSTRCYNTSFHFRRSRRNLSGCLNTFMVLQ